MTHIQSWLITAVVLTMVSTYVLADTAPAGRVADDYVLGPDSQVQKGVPQGKVTKYSWTSKIYAGTVRDYWVYVPAQYDAAKPACVMVFQDGGSYVDTAGQVRAPIVFDNLIARGDMPVTVGIFINSGSDTEKFQKDPQSAEAKFPDSERSTEYDILSDKYARFLMEEMLPEVGKLYNLTKDPDGRAICGASSGGICSFTVAWERPDAFRKVMSHVGSFDDIHGGYAYPFLIRKTDKKPIRVFLQDGINDINNEWGDWFLGAQQMASALKYKGYDYKFVAGDGGHTYKHGGSIFPESLKWLWRKE